MILILYFKKRINLNHPVKHNNGFTLIEVVIAMFILMLIVFTFTPFLLGSIERIYYAGDKSEALRKAKTDMEVNIVERYTIDGRTESFEFSNGTIVIVHGGMIETHASEGEAVAWLSTFLPYVPAIKLSDTWLKEGYVHDGNLGYPIVAMGIDTELNDDDSVYIYKWVDYEAGNTPLLSLDFDLLNEAPGNLSPHYDEYARFYLPEGLNGLTNAKSHYIVEFKWLKDNVEVKVRARLNIMLPAAIVVGENEIIVSPDASDNWNKRNNNEIAGNLNVINDVIWFFYRYIAVNSDGQALLWDDKIEPKIVEMGLGTISFNGLTAGNVKVVAVGNNGMVAVSTDEGETWEEKPVIIEDNGDSIELDTDLNAVEWNGNGFVAVGESGTIISSNNGSDWNGDYSIDRNRLNIYDLSYGNEDEAWVLVGDAPPAEPAADESRRYAIYRKLPDDSNFELIKEDDEGGSRLYGISYGTIEKEDGTQIERLVAVGHDDYNENNDGRIVTSLDGGDTWDETVLPNARFNNVKWNNVNKVFIAVGENGTIYTSSWNDETEDWDNWVQVNTDSSSNLKGVAIHWED